MLRESGKGKTNSGLSSGRSQTGQKMVESPATPLAQTEAGGSWPCLPKLQGHFWIMGRRGLTELPPCCGGEEMGVRDGEVLPYQGPVFSLTVSVGDINTQS